MNWTKSKSVTLSQVCVVAFGLLLAALDIGCYWAVKYLISVSHVLGGAWDGVVLMLVAYGCSIPAWMVLRSLWCMLRRIRTGDVFVAENVRQMRRTSWCCFLVGLICLAGSWTYPTLLVLAAAAAFMGLIVRIVKNVFEQAISMKNELDFTV